MRVERTKIIVSVVVITISQAIEEPTHPMITLLKFQNSAMYPTFTVKMVYAIPAATDENSLTSGS